MLSKLVLVPGVQKNRVYFTTRSFASFPDLACQDKRARIEEEDSRDGIYNLLARSSARSSTKDNSEKMQDGCRQDRYSEANDSVLFNDTPTSY